MDLLFQVITAFTVCCCLLLFKLLQDVRYRCNDYAKSVDSLKLDLPAPKLMELQALFTQLKAEFDGVLVENDAYRDKIYRQVQRNDTIMRRTERANEKLQAEDDDDEAPLPQIGQKPNDTVSVAASPTASPTVTGNSRADRQRRLRAAWMKNRGV